MPLVAQGTYGSPNPSLTWLNERFKIHGSQPSVVSVFSLSKGGVRGTYGSLKN